MTTLTPPRSMSEAAAGDPLLAVACPACHAALAAPRAAAGAPARCPLCLGAFLVPLPSRREQQSPDRQPDAPAEGRDTDPLRNAREEKSLRRARRNLLMLFSGVTILLAIVLLFGTRHSKKRR